MYQIVEIRLNDEQKVDLKSLIQIILLDLEKPKSYLIVKARAL
jgi:phosphotransferase system HPr-like phosphotransfer protein